MRLKIKYKRLRAAANKLMTLLLLFDVSVTFQKKPSLKIFIMRKKCNLLHHRSNRQIGYISFDTAVTQRTKYLYRFQFKYRCYFVIYPNISPRMIISHLRSSHDSNNLQDGFIQKLRGFTRVLLYVIVSYTASLAIKWIFPNISINKELFTVEFTLWQQRDNFT